MFLKIAFAISLVAIGTSSANPCKGSDKNIRNNKTYTDPDTKADHCFFRLPVEKEKDTWKPVGSVDEKHVDKDKATKQCLSYNARLPQLTNKDITNVFTPLAKDCWNCYILIGLTIKENASDPDTEKASMKVEWDKDSATVTITTKQIHDTDYYVKEPERCSHKMRMFVAHWGNWFCFENVRPEAAPAVFCHYDSTDKIEPATTKPAATTTEKPKGAASNNGVGSIEKIIALAATALIIR